MNLFKQVLCLTVHICEVQMKKTIELPPVRPVAWHWHVKELPQEKVVTVAGGKGGAQKVPACFPLAAVFTVTHQNKGSDLSQHLAFLFAFVPGPWSHLQTHARQQCAYSHNCVLESTKAPHEGLGLSSDKD